MTGPEEYLFSDLFDRLITFGVNKNKVVFGFLKKESMRTSIIKLSSNVSLTCREQYSLKASMCEYQNPNHIYSYVYKV